MYCYNLQATRKSSSLIFDDCRLWWLTHNDQLLIRHHDDTRKLWEPYPNVDKALEQNTSVILVRNLLAFK